MTEYEAKLKEVEDVGMMMAEGRQLIALAVLTVALDQGIKDARRQSCMYTNAISMGLTSTQVLAAGTTSNPFLLVDLLNGSNS